MKKISVYRYFLSLLLIFLTALPTFAQTKAGTPEPSTPESSALIESDVLALHAIHIANLRKLEAAGMAFFKPVSSDVRGDAWEMIRDLSQSELETYLLARQFEIDLSSTPTQLDLWENQVDQSFNLIEDADSLMFENVFVTQIHALNESLIATLDLYMSQGFVNNSVREFVQETYADVQAEIEDAAD